MTRDALDALLDALPRGVELGEFSALLAGDLAMDADLADLVGERHPEARDLFALRGHAPRIRPILVALAARVAGATAVDRNVQHVAELLHLALAVHDIALGREGGRRRRVARGLIKRSVGWLGGNHLTLRALELSRHGGSPEVMGELLDAMREFTEGQALCRELQGGRVPTEDDWLDHADSVTGALFAFCCRAGAWMGGSEPATLSALGRYGRHVGRLWHVAEDVAAIRHGDGPSHLLARALAARPVLPVIRAEDPELGALWAALVSDPSMEGAEEITRRVWASDGLLRCRGRMVREAWAAQKALSTLPPSPYRRAMERLAVALAKT